MKKYIGIMLKMGVVRLPQLHLYWSRHLRIPTIAEAMSRDRFTTLRRYIHFNNNNLVIVDKNNPAYDRFYKVRLVLESVRQACLQLELEEKMSIDEQMIPFKGKSTLNQYLPNKPRKWGFKAVSRCGVSGLTYDFFLYDGQPPKVETSCGYQPGDQVLKLCETLEKNRNFTLYYDNYYTFLELLKMLQSVGIWSVGTIRSNRLRGCPLISDKELTRRGRGSSDVCVDINSGVRIVKWFDNRVVHVASTHLGVEPSTDVCRWDRTKREHVEVSYVVQNIFT
jgi:hypothetical protein